MSMLTITHYDVSTLQVCRHALTLVLAAMSRYQNPRQTILNRGIQTFPAMCEVFVATPVRHIQMPMLLLGALMDTRLSAFAIARHPTQRDRCPDSHREIHLLEVMASVSVHMRRGNGTTV